MPVILDVGMGTSLVWYHLLGQYLPSPTDHDMPDGDISP